MLEYINKIREVSERLLTDGKVDMIIGFRKGTMPMMNEPCVVSRPEDTGKLVWDGNCGINLANYLTGRKENIGIVAKGCDTRNIVTHLIENKIKREQLVIIGVPCKGMIDKDKIADTAEGDITKVEERDGRVYVKGEGFDKFVEREDVLQRNCAVCTHRNPVIYDELAAELVEEPKIENPFADVEKIEAMQPEEKWNYFDELISECIRCYACRNACPLCYCPTCFVDESKPQWVGKGTDMEDIRTFHFLRAYHCAGRCTDCGACERACPMGIKVREFTRKLNRDCLELYGWEAGLSPNKRPPLDTFTLQDPQEFIK